MNQQQLQSLIDFLFEMDSIPSDLVREVNAAVDGFNNPTPSVKNLEISDPASIFCWKDMNSRLDTTCVVKLTSEQHPCFTMPVNGIITCNFGWNKSYNHNGIDINLRKGDKVSSAFDGIVRFAKWENGYGNVVVIRHPNGLETLYAHLSKIKVKVGELVRSGDVIGLGGATGNATGNHLHFEVRLKSKPINPKYLIAFEDQRLISDSLVFKSGRSGWAAYPPDIREYIVQKGDTIFEVAKRFGLSVKTLAEQNCINQWLRLKPGQIITIVG